MADLNNSGADKAAVADESKSSDGFADLRSQCFGPDSASPSALNDIKGALDSKEVAKNGFPNVDICFDGTKDLPGSSKASKSDAKEVAVGPGKDGSDYYKNDGAYVPKRSR